MPGYKVLSRVLLFLVLHIYIYIYNNESSINITAIYLFLYFLLFYVIKLHAQKEFLSQHFLLPDGDGPKLVITSR